MHAVPTFSCKPTKKCAMKMKETNKKKTDMRIKMLLMERKPFKMPIPKTSENDLHDLQVNNYGYNEGTICLVNR